MNEKLPETMGFQERFNQILSVYRVSIALGAVSTVCILLALLMLVKTSSSNEPIEFKDSNNIIGQSDNIVVDIAGGVVRPGVYRLASGSRIIDVIDMAGGLSVNANVEYVAKYVNQAQAIEDGAKLFIPMKEDNMTSHNVDYATQDSVSHNLTPLSGSESMSQNGTVTQDNKTLFPNVAGVSSLININSASQKELESLSGIGPAYAVKIIENRPYGSLEELVSRKVVGQKLFDKIKPYIGY